MGEFDFPDNYDAIMAARKAALVARQDALVEYDDTPLGQTQPCTLP